ncbi:MAG: Ig-like domain-containing protein [Rhodoglobus sp.]|nr:Ig-like domain-containing protein [Rhodoglobus sp.]
MIFRVRRTPATDPTDHADRRDPRIPRQSIGTRIASLFAAAALALTAVVVIPAAASAAPNPGIVVSNVVLTTSDGGPATVGDRLTVSGEWDASGANPQPGDTFTIGLPSVLGFPEAVPFTLDGPAPDGSTVSWATCLTDPGTGVATCTLTDEVAAFPELVMGSFEVEIEAILTTTEESVVFDLNGVATPVDLPGEGGIDDGITLPDTWDKSGEMNSDKWSMSWTINLPGSRLAGQETVTIFEQLSDNHQLCDPSQLRVQTVRGSTVVDVTSIASVSTDVAAPYDFSIVLTARMPN